jgi:hypothetical protein
MAVGDSGVERWPLDDDRLARGRTTASIAGKRTASCHGDRTNRDGEPARHARLLRGVTSALNSVPTDYRIDSEAGVMHVRFIGHVTMDEFVSLRSAATSDPQFHPGLHRLTDVRALTELPSIDELRGFAEGSAALRAAEPPGVRRAVLVESPAAFGVSRQYQAFLWLTGGEVDILASEAEAATWLAGLPAAKPEE